MKEKLQNLGRAMLIPLALITIAGFFMGLGGAFTSQATVKSIGLSSIIYEGSLVYNFFFLLKAMGDFIFSNLPILYAAGIAFGMAKKEQGWAAFSGVIVFLGIHAIISSMFKLKGINVETTSKNYFINQGYSVFEATKWNSLYRSEMGYFSYRMGIFGGFISGIMAQFLHNKFYKTKLPLVFSFFAGTRTVPIVAALAGCSTGFLLFYLWPIIGLGLAELSLFIGKSGLFGTFIWAILDKSLVPLGMHHLITTPIRWTELGGTEVIDGIIYTGTTGIQLAQMASESATKFLVRDFGSGRIPLHFGGLAGAALAIYHVSKNKYKQKVAGIMIPAVVIMLLFGITEPIEFTFLFVAPWLFYFVHVPLTGIIFVLCEFFKVSFYGGNVKDFLPVLLQPHKIHVFPYLFIVPLFFIVYYFLFKTLILKFNVITPGREDDIDENNIKLYKKNDYLEKKSENIDFFSQDELEKLTLAEKIIAALGGEDNIEEVDNCISRLRVTVKNYNLVAGDNIWKNYLEARGVVRNGTAIQIIYGSHVTMISSDVRELIVT